MGCQSNSAIEAAAGCFHSPQERQAVRPVDGQKSNGTDNDRAVTESRPAIEASRRKFLTILAVSEGRSRLSIVWPTERDVEKFAKRREKMTDSTTEQVRVHNNTIPIKDAKYISPRWDIDQERAFVETLVVQRTTFLFIVFGAVVAGAINSSSTPTIQLLILVGGYAFAEMLRQSIGRAQQKLDIILGILAQDPLHPYTVVTKLAGPKSKRKLIGYGIPFLCSGIIAVLAAINAIVFFQSHGAFLKCFAG